MSAKTVRPEVGLILYSGCQMAMVHGLTDMLHIAGRYAMRRGGEPVRVSHWRLRDGGGASSAPTTPIRMSPAAPTICWCPGG